MHMPVACHGRVPPCPTRPVTNVHLILYEHNGKKFYLDIPIAVVKKLVLKPHKYLAYLGWCVLGHEARVQWKNEQGEWELVNEEDEDFKSPGMFMYGDASTINGNRLVDGGVIKGRSQYSCSSLNNRDSAFKKGLMERDGACVFTWGDMDISGIHVIPHVRGDSWLKLILNNRVETSEDQEDVTDFHSIDDIRNGLLVAESIHRVHDSRRVAVLKTPNKMLKPEDVTPHEGGRLLGGNLREYPQDGSRYTLQWIAPSENQETQEANEKRAPNNVDAAFLKDTELPMPSPTLLHYIYGAAVVKWWGRNVVMLKDEVTFPRPQLEQNVKVVSRGPPMTRNDRTVVPGKLDREGTAEETSGTRTRRAGGDGTTDVEEWDGNGDEWDEEDVVMWFWSNNLHAARRAQEEEELGKNKIIEWRAGVPD